MLQLLINAGAQLHVRNAQGQTAVQLAVKNRCHQATLLLLGELHRMCAVCALLMQHCALWQGIYIC